MIEIYASNIKPQIRSLFFKLDENMDLIESFKKNYALADLQSFIMYNFRNLLIIIRIIMFSILSLWHLFISNLSTIISLFWFDQLKNC